MEKEELIQAYKEAWEKRTRKYIDYVEVGKILKVSGDTVHYHTEKNNMREELPDYFRCIHKTLHQFDVINEDSAYWLGYLMADGCYTLSKDKKSYRLMLECKITDKEILEKFCDFLQIRRDRITIGHNGASVALSMTDKVFSTSVSNYGIVYHKSHVETHLPSFCENDDLFLAYYKGIIDGDGTIHTAYGSPGVSFVNNSFSFCSEVKDKLSSLIPEPTSLWLMKKDIKQQGGKATQPIYSLKMGSGLHNRSNLRFLYEKAYKDKSIILTRKYLLLKSLISN